MKHLVASPTRIVGIDVGIKTLASRHQATAR